MRGTGRDAEVPGQDRGIIPARAGNSNASTGDAIPAGDHPRACGEQRSSRQPSCIDTGSSPRVRGTEGHVPDATRIQGIIPARAGNSYHKWVRLGLDAHNEARVVMTSYGGTRNESEIVDEIKRRMRKYAVNVIYIFRDGFSSLFLRR